MGKDKRGVRHRQTDCAQVQKVRKGSVPFSGVLSLYLEHRGGSQGGEKQTASKPPNQASGDIGLDRQITPFPRGSPLISPSHLSLFPPFSQPPKTSGLPQPTCSRTEGIIKRAARALPAVG